MNVHVESIMIPGIIVFILILGLLERVNVFDVFTVGVVDGLGVVYRLFPVFLGLFLAVTLLRVSGFLDFLAGCMNGIFEWLKIPEELSGLIILKPVSGSASMAIGTELMKKYGTDSLIGIMVATIMGATETTLYALAVYTGEINKKISLKLLILAIIGNFLGIYLSTLICRLYFN